MTEYLYPTPTFSFTYCMKMEYHISITEERCKYNIMPNFAVGAYYSFEKNLNTSRFNSLNTFKNISYSLKNECFIMN